MARSSLKSVWTVRSHRTADWVSRRRITGPVASAIRLGDDGICSHRQAGEHKGPGGLFMDIVRNTDGTLLVPVVPERKHPTDDAGSDVTASTEAKTAQTEADPATRLLHPGEGGYNEALAEWDLQQNPDRQPVVSTASGRQEAMTLVHAVAVSPDHAVAPAVEALDDPEASGEALRHVLVGGVHSVEDFAAEVAAAEGGEPLPAHEATKIIGEVLKELD